MTFLLAFMNQLAAYIEQTQLRPEVFRESEQMVSTETSQKSIAKR
jgi:hypothetical protein